MNFYKPVGYTSVSPYLVVSNAQASIDFLNRVFAAKELFKLKDEQGKIVHAELKIDDSVVMLADEQPGWESRPAHVHIYVADVDLAYQTALQAGASTIQAPTKKSDSDRRCGVQDLGGTTWWIATKIE